MKKIASKEGDLFLVPLRTNGYGLGMIVRKNKNIMLGYFWDVKYLKIPLNIDFFNLKESNTLWVKRFGSLGIDKGTWNIIGSHPNFNRKDWQIPAFLRDVAPFGKHFVIYNDELKELSATKIPDDVIDELSEEEISRMPKTGLAGYGFVELKLTDFLG